MRKEELENARVVLADNVKKLIEIAGSQPALVRVLKVPQKTISRAKNAENAANLDTVNDIAHGWGLHPWQLLVPGLDPDNPPTLSISTSPNQSSPNEPTTTKLAKLPKRGGSIPSRTPKVPQPKRG